MIIYTTNDRATRKAEEEAEKKRLEEENAATEWVVSCMIQIIFMANDA